MHSVQLEPHPVTWFSSNREWNFPCEHPEQGRAIPFSSILGGVYTISDSNPPALPGFHYPPFSLTALWKRTSAAHSLHKLSRVLPLPQNNEVCVLNQLSAEMKRAEIWVNQYLGKRTPPTTRNQFLTSMVGFSSESPSIFKCYRTSGMLFHPFLRGIHPGNSRDQPHIPVYISKT